MNNSRIFAGTNVFAATTGDFANLNASIGQVLLTSHNGVFANSFVSAPFISSLQLRTVQVDNGGVTFGASAAGIGLVNASTPKIPTFKRRKLTTPSSTYTEHDFVMRIV